MAREPGPRHERLGELCRRLMPTPAGLTADATMHRLVDHILAELRFGRPPEELEDSFDAVEELLLATGHSAGLGSYRTASGTYEPLPGASNSHPPLYVLACPLGHCARVEAPSPRRRPTATLPRLRSAAARDPPEAMTAFLNTLGGRLAERWMSLPAVPGLIYLTALVTAVTLGQRHWHDTERLRARLDVLAAAPGAHSPGAIAVSALAVLAGAAGVGAAVQAVGTWCEKAWLTDARGPVTRRLTARRLRRRQDADRAYRSAVVAAGRATIAGADAAGPLTESAERRHAVRARISLAAPRHPFWAGDRITTPEDRAWRAYRLDLTVAWPHLWLLAPTEPAPNSPPPAPPSPRPPACMPGPLPTSCSASAGGPPRSSACWPPRPRRPAAAPPPPPSPTSPQP
ncbi:hypothetical protein AB0L71_32055 [Streptomyces sp. NPDC052052]|uniref:hypothetical protein n=1 Tax=Streptomyces sp. NPDC052052 TaxID=3154756 RepID=UPI00341B2F8D